MSARWRRASRVLAVCAAASFTVAAVGGFALGSVGPGRAEHLRYAAALRLGTELDARLDADLARARLGAVAQFDDLSTTTRAARTNLGTLASPPSFLDDTERAALLDAVRGYTEATTRRLDEVERFKTELAVLRNSARFLTEAPERLARDTATPPADRAALGELLTAVLLLSTDPTPPRVTAARCALTTLGEPAPAGLRCPTPPGPPPRSALAHTFVRHARAVADAWPRMEARVNGLLAGAEALPLAEAARVYGAAHRHAAERRDALGRLNLAAASLGLACGAGSIITRLGASTRMLRESGARLEAALEALRRERDRATELADLRSRFVAMTSHELRTPLSIILSSSELLAARGAEWPEERRRRHVDRVAEAAAAMMRMLDRVLLLGRTEAGRLEVRPTSVELGELLAGYVRTHAGAAAARVRIEAPALRAELDDGLLGHVLGNLISNALKYSPEHSPVDLVARVEEGGLTFTVEDRGIGVPEAEIAGLFEPFQRASNAGAFGGHGLGLAMARRCAEAMGGSISLRSEGGACFTVRIPCRLEVT